MTDPAASYPPNTEPVHTELATQLQAVLDNKTKPHGSLGRIEELAHQIGMIQATTRPVMDSCELTVFAADHGMANAGVSAYPQAVTRQMVLNFLQGGAASNVFCNTLDIAFTVVDAGVAGDAIQHTGLLSRRIGAGTANAIEGPAMSHAQCDTALNSGYDIGSSSSAQAVCFGEMGIGNTSSATLLCHKLLGLALEDITGAGTGLDDNGIQHKRNLLRTAARRTDISLSAHQALQEYGGFEIAMMAGAMRAAADHHKLIIVDGFIATAAAVVALQLQPDIKYHFVFAHASEERGHKRVLEAIKAKPLLNLGLRLGEGTGALLAWPLIKSAAAMLNNMASFESAQVSGPSAKLDSGKSDSDKSE